MKKQLLIAGTLAIPSLVLAGSAYAMSQPGDRHNNQLAEKIAAKFNLNQEEVESFLKADRDAMKAEMESNVNEALKSAGFTDEQISALKNKKQEQKEAMKSWREANPNATREEMKAAHEQEKAEFEAWAKVQGIDLEKVRSTLQSANLVPLGHGHHR